MAANDYIPVGSTFGSLTVEALERLDKRNGPYVIAMCTCGVKKIYRLAYLKNGHTQSCGCLRGRRNKARATHGHTPRVNRNPTYSVYRDMRTRCENPNYREFHLYGGRGITVCERWRQSYEHFLADMEERPDGMTLERKDVNGPYSPENCVWASVLDQANNKRNSVIIEYQGRAQTIAQWSRELGILDKTIYLRWAKGCTPERALAPVKR